MRRPIILAVALCAVVLGTASLSADVAGAGDAGTPHYPDLQTLPPSDVRVQRDRVTGTRELRFSNTVANLGPGRLEVLPVNYSGTGITEAYQRVYTHDVSGAWSILDTVHAGTFEFHASHGHWHFEGFALYELRGVASDGTVGDQVVASSDKISFCMMDTTRVSSAIQHSSNKTYSTCTRDEAQGISVGWADTYSWRLAGQSLDITNVPNGVYWLVSTADPDGRLLETDDGNNRGAVQVSIKGNKVTVLK